MLRRWKRPCRHISQIFQILNTPKEKRFKNLDENLAAFPYVNGKLFEEHLPAASFDISNPTGGQFHYHLDVLNLDSPPHILAHLQAHKS
ncbi:MAG: hypothetical protein H0V14_03760 [Chitinophagaceae bacterium]|nr:hypothetical protein [Chitinophagaceae bacterium]